MREIKFRGKRVSDGVWVYGSLLQDYWSSRNQKRVTAIVYPGCFGERDNRDVVDPASVGQYTGYNARSGHYIFEGDIITGTGWSYSRYERLCDKNHPAINEKRIVTWGDDGWTLPNIKGRVPSGIGMNKKNARRFTVIGKAHDNPELLIPCKM